MTPEQLALQQLNEFKQSVRSLHRARLYVADWRDHADTMLSAWVL